VVQYFCFVLAVKHSSKKAAAAATNAMTNRFGLIIVHSPKNSSGAIRAEPKLRSFSLSFISI